MDVGAFGMMVVRASAAVVAIGSVIGAVQAESGETLLQAGAYEVQVTLSLPNVQTGAAAKTTICIPQDGGVQDPPLPVLSGNNPLAQCPASDVRRDGATLSFEIRCAGRDAARGRAVYTLMPRAFEGRIAMVMGGKNMTMTETQKGHRVGDCDPAG